MVCSVPLRQTQSASRSVCFRKMNALRGFLPFILGAVVLASGVAMHDTRPEEHEPGSEDDLGPKIMVWVEVKPEPPSPPVAIPLA